MKFLLTGASGMVGAHMCRLLWSAGHEVHAIARPRAKSSVLSAEEWGHVIKHSGDITDTESLAAALATVQPDRVVHLAAQSLVPASWTAPFATASTNILGTLSLLEACRRSAPGARVLVAGSSEEYGLVLPDEVPITENQPLRPLSPYGTSKIATDFFGYQYWKSHKLHVIRTRAFNHFAQGRNSGFFEGSMAEQIAKIEAGKQEPVIAHGNLDAVRDYTDARDTCLAYLTLLENGVPGEVYNICSGSGLKMREVLDIFLEAAFVKGIQLIQDPKRERPSDVPLLIGSYNKLHAQTGWQPQIPIKNTLRDLLEWHRTKISS